VALVTLGSPDQLTGGYEYHRRMAELAPHLGAQVTFISLPQRPFPLPMLASRSIVRPLESIRPHALVIDSIAAAYVPAARVSVPLIGSLHQPPGGVGSNRLRHSIQMRMDLAAYRACRRLIVASQSLADLLRSYGLGEQLIHVVPPGKDVATPTGDQPRDLRHGRRIAVLCVANWLPHKGITELLEALALLPDETATLHLAGDTTRDKQYAHRVRQMLHRPDLGHRVVVHGPIDPGAVASLYRDADVFVLVSRQEAYGTVYGEAMHFGLPVVGWRSGNLPNLASESEGIMVETGSIDGLARAIRLLADHPEFRRHLSEGSRRRSADRPTWRESAERFFRVIGEAMGSRAHATPDAHELPQHSL